MFTFKTKLDANIYMALKIKDTRLKSLSIFRNQKLKNTRINLFANSVGLYANDVNLFANIDPVSCYFFYI